MGVGGAGKGGTARHATKGQNFMSEVRQQGIALDPDLNQASFIANRLGGGLDLLNAPRIQARRSADEAQQGISSALAARGGGQFADALLQGTRSRVGTELAGLIQGQQAELGMRTTKSNLLHQIGATRQGLFNAAFGSQANFAGQVVPSAFGHDAQMAQLQWQQQQAMMDKIPGLGGQGGFLSQFMGTGPQAKSGASMGGGLTNLFGLLTGIGG